MASGIYTDNSMYEIVLSGWDDKYFYYDFLGGKIKYDIANKKFIIDGYTRIDYSELKYIK